MENFAIPPFTGEFHRQFHPNYLASGDFSASDTGVRGAHHAKDDTIRAGSTV
jgi:hypothetical protein